MIDKQEFKEMQKEIEEFDEKREQVIQQSRDIIKVSKQIIYAVHRNDMKNAAALVKQIESKKSALVKFNYLDVDTNMGKVALQEYVEALTFYEFMKTKNLPTKKSLRVDSESYLLGLCDLTGELTRKAVNSVINKNITEASLIRELVDQIYGEFLHFDLRNSELRKKSDQIKWNLAKLEDLLLGAKQ